MPTYHDDEQIVKNDDEMYEELLESRGIKSIEHYRTKRFDNLNIRDIRCLRHTWSYGDTLHKLAVNFYGDAESWWVIGLANGKPTDAHYKVGDVILIPINPSEFERE